MLYALFPSAHSIGLTVITIPARNGLEPIEVFV